MKVSSEFAQDHQAWGASIRDVVSTIGDAGSTHPYKLSTISGPPSHLSQETMTCLDFVSAVDLSS